MLDDVDIRPTLEDVASLIRARTKDDVGNELGTFTEATRPTAEQAEEEINHAETFLGTVVAKVGEQCADVAREAVRITAAARIERAYWPEQARAADSVYAQLLEEQRFALEGVASCVAGTLPGDPRGGFRVVDLEVWAQPSSPFPDDWPFDTEGWG